MMLQTKKFLRQLIFFVRYLDLFFILFLRLFIFMIFVAFLWALSIFLSISEHFLTTKYLPSTAHQYHKQFEFFVSPRLSFRYKICQGCLPLNYYICQFLIASWFLVLPQYFPRNFASYIYLCFNSLTLILIVL